MTRGRTRRGFALATAVFMLSVVGSLAAASYFTIREAQRTATRLTRRGEAASSADTALFALLAAWKAPQRDSLPIGATDSSHSVGGDRDSYVTRITNDVFSLAAVGRAAVGTTVEATRGHGLLVRIVRPTLLPPAALVSRGDVVVAPDAALSGSDRPPQGWVECPPPDSMVAPAVMVPEGRAARDLAGRLLPDQRVDSAAADSNTYRRFGPATIQFLADRADIVLRAGAMLSPRPSPGDKCNSSDDIASWGEPLRLSKSSVCERYFPIIRGEGDIVVTAGRGQGLLIVEGRLRIEGPFVFYGVIVAASGIDASGSAVSVYGVVLSGSVNGVRWGAGGQLQRSTCAVTEALAAASRPAPIGLRGWSELF